MNKMQMGKLSGALLLALFVGCGLVHPDAPITDLAELIPTGNFHQIDCESATFEDQNGVAPDTIADVGISSAWKKFGTYSMLADSGLPGAITYDDVVSLTQNMGFGAWVNITELAATHYLWQAYYYVDSNNWLLLGVFADASGLYLDLTEMVGGVQAQQVRIDSGLSISQITSGPLYIGGVYYPSTGELDFIINDTVLGETASALTLSGASATNYTRVLSANHHSSGGGYTTIYVDDIIFAWDDACNPDLFVQHYLSNLPWSTEYAYADLPIIPASGGYVNLKNSPTKHYAPTAGEESAGTLHMIPEADRPSSWVLNGGTQTSFTDVNFSSYVPVGVKALFLKFAISWTGNGTVDYSGWQLRQNGSSVTSEAGTDVIFDYFQNLASGTNRQVYGQITALCDADGIIEYRFYGGGTAVGALYLNIVGYYI